MQKNVKSTAKKRKNAPRRILVKILIFAAIVYCTSTLIFQQISLSRANDAIIEYNSKILEETDNMYRLQNELAKVNTNEYLIQKAREKLGLVRANERIFIDASKMGNN